MTQEKNMIIVNREKNVISATINDKKIKLTFDELSTINKLFLAVRDDYTGKACVAYEEDNGKIKLI